MSEKEKFIIYIFCFYLIGFLETLSISIVFPLFAILVIIQSYLIGNTFFQNVY